MTPQSTTPHAIDVARVQAGFLTILSAVERHARFAFRHLHSYHDREDAVAETVAVAWAWFVQLARRGRDAATFPSALASYASRHVKSGRRLCGAGHARDVMSPTARRRLGFSVEQLPQVSSPGQPAWEEALIDNTQSPVLDQVAFRVDFPDWLDTLGTRDRRITEAMASGHRTLDLARDFDVSPGRVSQLRRDLHRSWHRFHAKTGTESPRDTVTAA